MYFFKIYHYKLFNDVLVCNIEVGLRIYHEACNQASNTENGKIEMIPAILFEPESTVESERFEMNKEKFISVI